MGFALAALLGLTIALASSRTRRRAAPSPSPEQSPAGPPPEDGEDLTPPPTAPLPPPEQAADAVREGSPTSEDYQALEREARRRGEEEAARRFREQAAEAPTQREVEQAAETVDESEEAPAPAPEDDPDNPAPGYAPPAGFDPMTADALAPQVAQNIESRRRGYDRPLLRRFQRAAGIVVDGMYGAQSRAALVFYGVSDPPAPLFGQRGTTPIQSYPEALVYHAERQGYGL